MNSFIDRVNSYYLPRSKDSFLQGVIAESLNKGKNITVRCSSEPYPQHPASSIIQQGEMTGDNYYHSLNSNSDSWVEVQFNEEWVIPTNIVMADSGNDYRIRNWNFEASQNGNNYDILQMQTNDEIYQERWQIEQFPIKNRTMKPYRFFRIQQTGLTSNNTQSLRVGRLEVFGITAFCTNFCTIPPKFPEIRKCTQKDINSLTFLAIFSILLFHQ